MVESMTASVISGVLKDLAEEPGRASVCHYRLVSLHCQSVHSSARRGRGEKREMRGEERERRCSQLRGKKGKLGPLQTNQSRALSLYDWNDIRVCWPSLSKNGG